MSITCYGKKNANKRLGQNEHTQQKQHVRCREIVFSISREQGKKRQFLSCADFISLSVVVSKYRAILFHV